MEIAADLHRLQGGNKPCKLLCCGGGTPHRPPVLTPQGFVLHEGSELAQFLAWEARHGPHHLVFRIAACAPTAFATLGPLLVLTARHQCPFWGPSDII